MVHNQQAQRGAAEDCPHHHLRWDHSHCGSRSSSSDSVLSEPLQPPTRKIHPSGYPSYRRARDSRSFAPYGYAHVFRQLCGLGGAPGHSISIYDKIIKKGEKEKKEERKDSELIMLVLNPMANSHCTTLQSVCTRLACHYLLCSSGTALSFPLFFVAAPSFIGQNL